ncbi:MAG: hypothetical protein MI742_10960 [Desulfobacterales bacterium]|nr:hypothetical protein [Desulfobacterales bacterium]
MNRQGVFCAKPETAWVQNFFGEGEQQIKGVATLGLFYWAHRGCLLTMFRVFFSYFFVVSHGGATGAPSHYRVNDDKSEPAARIDVSVT